MGPVGRLPPRRTAIEVAHRIDAGADRLAATVRARSWYLHTTENAVGLFPEPAPPAPGAASAAKTPAVRAAGPLMMSSAADPDEGSARTRVRRLRGQSVAGGA